MANQNQLMGSIQKMLLEKKSGSKALLFPHKEEVEEGLKQGCTAKNLWQMLISEEKIFCSYSTFTRFVKQNIEHKTTKGSPAKKQTGLDPSQRQASGFVYNPVPNHDELF